ncbi:mannitol dehydrogenase family protein [Teichococcus vastitatis]|uniref:mannitol dehydrogenase family protein n=1 Tax=Teichococcus vastitatis TaxID=2307076 RepID=UPI000E724734|nr:mannitol dehydrogenase family protein [Pseudoroseomonas vastitatis]
MLDLLPRSVARPGFDVTALRPGILHLGCGAFHRAHQAVFTQRALQAGNAAEPEPWGIVAASLRKADMRDALRPQHGLYTVLERGAEGIVRAEVVGTVREVLYAPQQSAALAARFVDPDTHIVTLTVTSAAYCIDTVTGHLCVGHPDIQRDLQGAVPQSAIGILVAGLAQVRQAGLRPPVVMSCDNLAGNGRVLRQAVMDYAALQDESLADWIGASVQFPCSMVDRIVPASTEVDQADAAAMLGLQDAAPVSAEPFRQWVIEDFDGPRPRWEDAGAEFVSDVAPWEASKLRLLNGTHMAIAYVGALAGLRSVSEFMADPAFGSYALRFMLREQMPTLPPSDHDITAYAHQLLQRWRNPGIVHRLTRVGRNGSEKLQTRLLASLRENFQAGRPAPCTTLAVAAWICCASGSTGQSEPVQMEDTLEHRLKAIGQAAGDDAERLTDLALSVEEAFGTELPRCAAFRADLVQAVTALQRGGARAAVRGLMA